MITIAELIAPVTPAQQEETFLKTLEGVGLAPRAWRKGGSLRTILYILAICFAGVTNLLAGFAASGFIDTSTGGWLTLLAYSVYGVTRIPATLATGTVTLVNAGGGVYTLPAGALSVASSVTGATYTNVSGFTLSSGATLDVPIAAITPGASSSAPANTITKMVTVLAGVTANNAIAVVGADAESDAALRQRCKDKLGTLSGLGPRGAYQYAVRSSTRPDGSAVNINRLSISPSSSTGVVTVYVASPTGAPLSTDLTYVQASIEKYARPDSVTALTLAATPITVTRTLTAWAIAQTGVSEQDLKNAVGGSLALLSSTYPIGGVAKVPAVQGYLYASRIEGAVTGAHPSIFAVDGAGSDVAMAEGDVATLAYSLTVRIVSKEIG